MTAGEIQSGVFPGHLEACMGLLSVTQASLMSPMFLCALHFRAA